MWRNLTPEEMALVAFPAADDWVVRGTPDKPSLSTQPVWYSSKLGVKVPYHLISLWHEAHRRHAGGPHSGWIGFGGQVIWAGGSRVTPNGLENLHLHQRGESQRLHHRGCLLCVAA